MMQQPEEERIKTLTFIGLPHWMHVFWLHVFKNPAQALRVWMGEELMYIVSTKVIAEHITKQIKDLQSFKTSIEAGEDNPIYMEGEFGNNIRAAVYKKRGFKLSPYAFPHSGEVAARTSLKASNGSFGSEAGYLYARAVSAEVSRRERNKWLKIFALVIASVALVLIAGAAGAALAGLMFSTATVAGTVGFVVTELVVTAGIVTLAGPAMQTFIMSGGSATGEDYEKAYQNLGTQFVVNLATFGFFKALGAATRAIAVAGAGGKQAFAASRAWRAADVGMRVTTSGGAFIGIGVLSNYLQSGKVPEGKQMNELLFETALSVVLLEVGAYATRGPMKQLQQWSRAQRLGVHGPAMDKLLIEATLVNAEVAEFAARPHEAAEKGPELITRQKDILARQKTLVEEMKKSFRTRGDAKDLEFQLGRMTEEFDLLINQLKDVEFFAKAKIKPGGRLADESPVFTYERGQEKEIIDYYGKENVKEADGGLLVTQNGQQMVFRPATPLDPSLSPAGTRTADALDTWRSTLTSKKIALLEKAFSLAETSTELEKIQRSDPATMKEKDLLKFEKTLASAEKAITKTGLTKTAVNIKDIGQLPGESTETWRLRLVEIKNNLLQRADLLGYESIASFLRKLQTGRPNLVKETLLKHANAMETARAEIDRQWGEQFQQEKARQALAPDKDISVIKERIKQRQEEIKRRARAYNASDSGYIKEATKNMSSATKLSTLRDIEVLIEKAEARLDKAAAEAMEKAEGKFGKDTINAARTGELAGLSDQQVGDAMRMLKGYAGTLSPEAIRGALYASMPPPGKSTAASQVPLEKAVSFARSPGELNFVLESYLAINEAGIEGAYQLMRDATTSSGKWKGAVWQLELIRIVIGTQKVKAVEVKVPGREIDILLHDGSRIEAKDWNTWDAAKLEKQFVRDLDAETNGGKNADGIKKIQWSFRDPLPVSETEVLTTMKSALEKFITEKMAAGSIGKTEADNLRKAFNEHTGLLSVPKIDAKHVAPPKPLITNPPMPPHIKNDDEKKQVP